MTADRSFSPGFKKTQNDALITNIQTMFATINQVLLDVTALKNNLNGLRADFIAHNHGASTYVDSIITLAGATLTFAGSTAQSVLFTPTIPDSLLTAPPSGLLDDADLD